MKFAGGASRSDRAQTTGLQSSQLQHSQISSASPSGHQQPVANPLPPPPAQQQQQVQQQLKALLPQQQHHHQQQEKKPQQQGLPKSPARDDIVLKPGDLVPALPKKTPPPVLPRQKTFDKERAPPPPVGPTQCAPPGPPPLEHEPKAKPGLSPQFNHHTLGAKDSLEGHEDLPCCRATMDLFPGGMAEESSNL